MLVGDAIKTIRKRKNLNQKELSALCNISQTYLSQIENNRKVPNFDTIERIGNCLGIPIPVVMFLSLTENDVRDDKRPLFEMMNPTIQKFINDIFINTRA